ncbi:MAG: hypothetical protein ACK4F7_00795 [Inhella sp.]
MDETVFTARHGFEGQLIIDLLRQAGLDPELRGDGLIGGAGELPVIGLVQVRVPSAQLIDAHALIDAWERGEFELPQGETD